MKDLTIEAKDWKVHQDYQEKRAKRAEEERKKEMEEAKKMRSERIRARVREKSRRAKEMEENMQREVKTSSSTTVSVTRESEDDTINGIEQAGSKVTTEEEISSIEARLEQARSNMEKNDNKSYQFVRRGGWDIHPGGGLRGGAPGKIKITNKSKERDCKDIKDIEDLPDEEMGTTNPPQIPKLRYRGGTAMTKLSVESIRKEDWEEGEDRPKAEYDIIKECPKRIPSWAKKLEEAEPIDFDDFDKTTKQFSELKVKFKQPIDRDQFDQMANQLSELTLLSKDGCKEMFSTTERLQQEYFFPTSCRLGAAKLIDRDDGSKTDADNLRNHFNTFHTKPLAIDWDCNQEVAQTLKRKEKQKSKSNVEYKYDDKDFPGVYGEIKNCLNPEEFRDCLTSLGFSVGQDEQGESNFQRILSIVDPKDPTTRLYTSMKPGYISVDRFLDFMNRPDLDEFRPGNQEVIQDDEEEFDNFEVDVFGLQRQSDNSEPEAMEDRAVSLSLLTESESNKRRWMELMSSGSKKASSKKLAKAADGKKRKRILVLSDSEDEEEQAEEVEGESDSDSDDKEMEVDSDTDEEEE